MSPGLHIHTADVDEDGGRQPGDGVCICDIELPRKVRRMSPELRDSVQLV